MKEASPHQQQTSAKQVSPASEPQASSMTQKKSALGTSPLVQRRGRSSEKLQESSLVSRVSQQQAPLQRKANNTGLPDNLKSGVENLSGYSMDDVRVHYNSSKPAQLQAHAYAQGTDIHLAPGQEKHLPHEAWHVVQQKQGRVRPTMQMKGKVKVNDDAGLEREADVMGGKAAKGPNSVILQLKKHTFPHKAESNISNYGSTYLIGANRNIVTEAQPLQTVSTGSWQSTIQMVGPWSLFSRTDNRQAYRDGYWESWMEEVADFLTLGNYQDLMMLSLEMRDRDTPLYLKIEALLRYLQHHPEIFIMAGYIGLTVPSILSTGYLWSILSYLGGATSASDSSGILGYAGNMYGSNTSTGQGGWGQWILGGAASLASYAVTRRMTRSVGNRILVALEPFLGRILSVFSRIVTGYEVREGSSSRSGRQVGSELERVGPRYRTRSPGNQQRLHLQPARALGRRDYPEENIVMGTASTNHLMDSYENAHGIPNWVAISRPTGWAEAVGTNYGATLIRANRAAVSRTEDDWIRNSWFF